MGMLSTHLRRFAEQALDALGELYNRSRPTPAFVTIDHPPSLLRDLRHPPANAWIGIANFSTARGGGRRNTEEASPLDKVRDAMRGFLETDALRAAMQRTRSWTPLIRGIEAAGSSPQVLETAVRMLNFLTPPLIVEIQKQDGWSAFGAIAARAGNEKYTYFQGSGRQGELGLGFEVTAKIVRGLATVTEDRARIAAPISNPNTPVMGRS